MACEGGGVERAVGNVKKTFPRDNAHTTTTKKTPNHTLYTIMPKTKKKAFAKSVCQKTYYAHRNSLYPKLHLKKRVTVDIGKFLPDTTVLEMNNLRLEIPKETLLQAISSTATAEVECDVTFDTNDVHAYFTQRKRTLERPLIKKDKE